MLTADDVILVAKNLHLPDGRCARYAILRAIDPEVVFYYDENHFGFMKRTGYTCYDVETGEPVNGQYRLVMKGEAMRIALSFRESLETRELELLYKVLSR